MIYPLLLSFFFFHAPLLAQSDGSLHSVELKVRAKGTGVAVKRAEIKVERDIFYTDKDGLVKLSLPATPDKKIAILKVRFATLFVPYADLLKENQFEVFLYPDEPDDNEIVIRGVKRSSVSRKTITKEESSRIAPDGDPVQVTRLMPGVQTSNFSPEVVVRGSGPNDSLYLIDNFRVLSIFHNIARLSIMPEQLLSDVEFSAGGFGAQYGDVTGGVIVLRTKSEIPERPLSEVRINLPFYLALFHERPLSETQSLAVSYRRSYIEHFLRPFLRGDSAPTVVPYFTDAHVMYTQRNEDGGQFKVLGLGTGDGLKLAMQSDEATSDDGRANIDFKNYYSTLGVDYQKPLSKGWSYNLTPQYLFNRLRGELIQDSFNMEQHYALGRSEFAKSLGGQDKFYLGYEPMYVFVKINAIVPDLSEDPYADSEEAPRKEFKKHIALWFHSGWASYDQRMGSLLLTPGVRAFYNAQIKETGLDPRINARVELGSNNVLKAAVGQYSQHPQPEQGDPTLGNSDLKFERSMHYVLGFERHFTERLHGELQFYYKNFYDVIVPSKEKKYSNDGSRFSKGVEVFLRRNLTEKWFGWLAYTYSQTHERNRDEDSFHSGQFDQTHVTTLTGSYRVTSTWDLGLRFNYHTGDTYTPINDAVYNANLDKYQERPSDLHSGRLPSYNQLDLFATKDILYDTMKLAINFGIQYLTLKPNIYAKSYNYDYSQEKDFTELPPIPFVEFRGVF